MISKKCSNCQHTQVNHQPDKNMETKIIISPQPKCKTCGNPMNEWNPFADEHEHVNCISERIANAMIEIIKTSLNHAHKNT